MRTKTCKICGKRMCKNGGAWCCDECGATEPLRKPGPAPDVALRLGDERRAWLEAHGGASAWIKSAIDGAMEAEALEERSEPGPHYREEWER